MKNKESNKFLIRLNPKNLRIFKIHLNRFGQSITVAVIHYNLYWIILEEDKWECMDKDLKKSKSKNNWLTLNNFWRC